VVDKQGGAAAPHAGPLRFPLGARPPRPVVTTHPYAPQPRRTRERPVEPYQQQALEPCPPPPPRLEQLSPPQSPSVALERYAAQLAADLVSPPSPPPPPPPPPAAASTVAPATPAPAPCPAPRAAAQTPLAPPPQRAEHNAQAAEARGGPAGPPKPAAALKPVLQRGAPSPSRAAGGGGGGGAGGGGRGGARKPAPSHARGGPGAGPALAEACGQAIGAPVKRKRDDYESELLDRLLNSAGALGAPGAPQPLLPRSVWRRVSAALRELSVDVQLGCTCVPGRLSPTWHHIARAAKLAGISACGARARGRPAAPAAGGALTQGAAGQGLWRG